MYLLLDKIINLNDFISPNQFFKTCPVKNKTTIQKEFVYSEIFICCQSSAVI